MARFYGEVGFGKSVETVPGVWEDVITARKYYGDVLRNTLGLDNGSNVNDDISVSNSISIVADGYAHDHIPFMRYIYWMGTCWTVASVEVKSPRLVLRLGGVYTGPTAPAPDAS